MVQVSLESTYLVTLFPSLIHLAFPLCISYRNMGIQGVLDEKRFHIHDILKFAIVYITQEIFTIIWYQTYISLMNNNYNTKSLSNLKAIHTLITIYP